MIPKLVQTALIATALTACQTTPTGITEEDRLAIETSSRNWVEIYNQNDWEALSKLFTPDATIMPPNGPAVTGRAAIAEWERANETGFQIAFKLETIDGDGDTAYVRGRSCVFIPDGTVGMALMSASFSKFVNASPMEHG